MAKHDRSDWREKTLARMRALILQADPEIIEERKWRKPTNPSGVPVWSPTAFKRLVKAAVALNRPSSKKR